MRGQWGAALCLTACLGALAAGAETLRLATYGVEMGRKGPGLLLRDILGGKDAQVSAVAQVIAAVAPDAILLTGFDYDLNGVALTAFAGVLTAAGQDYPYRFALRPNSGWATGLDLNGDGRLGGPGDAQGFGWFAGQNGLAILSKVPIDAAGARDFSALLWRDLPGARLPEVDGKPFPSEGAQAVQRLSSVAHWDVPLILPTGGRLHLLAFQAGPPVFDGPEDRNGLRNRDEVRFWPLYLDGALATPPPDGPLVVVGGANLDPARGQGDRAAITALLADPRLQDPHPKSPGATEASAPVDTVAWDAPGEPGNMRVDYVLPSADLTVTGAGVFWPERTDPAAALLGDAGRGASRHRLVWVDVTLP